MKENFLLKKLFQEIIESYLNQLFFFSLKNLNTNQKTLYRSNGYIFCNYSAYIFNNKITIENDM